MSDRALALLRFAFRAVALCDLAALGLLLLQSCLVLWIANEQLTIVEPWRNPDWVYCDLPLAVHGFVVAVSILLAISVLLVLFADHIFRRRIGPVGLVFEILVVVIIGMMLAWPVLVYTQSPDPFDPIGLYDGSWRLPRCL